MSDRFTLKNFLKEFITRITAAIIIVGIFFGLGYINRIDFLGFSNIIGNQFSFFIAVFFIISLISISWILYQNSKN